MPGVPKVWRKSDSDEPIFGIVRVDPVTDIEERFEKNFSI